MRSILFTSAKDTSAKVDTLNWQRSVSQSDRNDQED